jgi:hypothetical protein
VESFLASYPLKDEQLYIIVFTEPEALEDRHSNFLNLLSSGVHISPINSIMACPRIGNLDSNNQRSSGEILDARRAESLMTRLTRS